MSTIKISDGLLTSFYNQNPNFDILQFNLSDESALSQLNWNGLDRPAILDLLKKYQRLLRLHHDPAVTTALLNPSPQPAVASPAPQTATPTLSQPSLDSAHAIATIPETEFVQNFGLSVGGAAIAKQIHQNARNVTAKTALFWANVQNLVAAPHFRTMLANNVGDDIHQFENFPSYQELFGSLDFCKCEQCQSIFSPAAYFVDLMRLTEEKIKGNPNHKIDPDFILNARRPDLAQIPLTCAATNDLVPYLDIVNKVVALKVDGLLRNPAPTTPQAENQAIDRAYYTLATAAYPWTLPFNLPLEQIRSYLGYLKTDLATVYQTFNVVEAGKAAEKAVAQIADANKKQTAIREAQLAQVSVARETLGLSIEEYTFITTPRTADADLTAVYGLQGNDLGGLSNLDTFLKQTGLSRQELHNLFYQNLSQAELAQGLAYNFYINQTPLLSQPTLMGYWPLNEGTGTSISDNVSRGRGAVQGASWQTTVDFLEGSRSVLQFNGKDNYVSLPNINFDYSKGFTIEAWVYYKDKFKKWSRIIDFGNGAASQNIILTNDGTSGTLAFVVYSEGKATQIEVLNALQTNTWIHLAVTVDASGNTKLYKNGQQIQSGSTQIPQNTNRTKNYIGKSNWDSDGYFYGQIANVQIWNRSLNADEIQTHFSNSYCDLDRTLKNLNLPTLDRINRFVRLAKKLNWSFADLDWVLTSIGVTGTRDIDPDAIQKLARIKQLQATTNLPLDVLCSFWHDIKTIGIGNYKSSQARFDILFNNPQLLGENPPYCPTYSGNPLYTSQVLRTPDANGKIIAGLQFSLNDLTTLIQAFWDTNNSDSNPATIDLTVQNLSVLYRHTLLASLLRLPIDQYLILLRLVTQKDPKESLVFSIDALVSMLENRVWLIASGFNVYELDYVLNGNESQFVDKKYKDENIQAFLQTLQALDTDLQPELQASDILDWNGFLGKLNNPAQNSPNPNRYLWSLLSSAVQRDVQQVVTDINKLTPEKKDAIVQALNSILKKPDLWSLLSSEDQQDIQQVVTDISKLTSERKDAIVQALNSILKKPDFYKEPEFSGVVIPVVVKELLVSEEILSLNEMQKLNRLLLETVYPQEIAQANIKDFSDQWKEKLIEQIAIFLGSTTDIIKSLLEISGRRLALPDGVSSYIEAFLTRDLNYAKKVIRALSRGLVLNQKLQLTQAEIDSIFSHPACYGIDPDSQQATLDNIKSLFTFKQLTKAFNDIQDNLVHYFAKVSAAQFIESTAQEELAKVTGWDKAQIKELVEKPFLNNFSLYNSVTGITKLKKAFDLSQSLGVNISFYESLVALAAKTIATNADWQNYNNTAQSIAEIVKAKHKDSDWETISTKINCALNELKRSALTGFALWKLGQQDSSMNNLRTLSEYLLIDVETTGCASISYIKQAILSVQMYLQRCRINLEPGVTQVEIPEIWWEWMMNYRVWEANRKVFLYPENYIEPNLRKNKTDLFQELESELLQSDVTQEAAEAAYHNYFDKLAELAKLRVAATYRYFVPQPDGSKEDTLFVFGKTATEPHSYYYRKCINPTANHSTWTPWSKIDVGINSEYISPAFAFNKLFVFWVEITQNTSSSSSNNSQQKTTVKKATIKYSFQTVSQKWLQPQTLSKDIIINADPDNYSLDGIDIDLNTEKLFWKKVYPLTIPEQNSEPEKVLVMFGDIPSLPTIPATTLTNDLLIENRFLTLKMEWLSPIKLSQARGYLTATSVGSLAFFAGGISSIVDTHPVESDIVDIYDAEAGQLLSSTKLPQARKNLAATSVGSLAFFAGASSHSNVPSDIVDIYDAETRQWLSPIKLPHARFGLAATSVGSLAFFAGGYSSSSTDPSDIVDIYDAEVGQWLSSTKLPHARSFLAATSVGSLAFFAGGISSSSSDSSDIVDIYDAEVGQWLSPIKLSQARSGLAATSVGSLAFFVGGDSRGGSETTPFHDTVEIYISPGMVVGNYYCSDFISTRDPISTTAIGQNQANSLGKKLGLGNISTGNISILTVKNQSGWLTFDNGDEAFLVIPLGDSSKPFSEGFLETQSDGLVDEVELQLSYNNFAQTIPTRYTFTRLTTSILRQLSQKAFIGGIDHLLTLESQLTPELDFNRFSPSSAVTSPVSRTLDFNGSYGLYFQEIFFHIPFLIANTLNTNQRFAEAQKWYHYIFNPTQPQPIDQGLVGYWPLNEESGTTVNDKAGRNNGTVQGTSLRSKATDFPGGDRSILQFNDSFYVEIHDPFVNATNFTIGLWVKPSTINDGSFHGFIGKQEGSYRKPGMWLSPSDGALHYASHSDSRVHFFDSLPNFFTSTEEWVQITWVKDDQEYRFYRNGKLFATRLAPPKIYTVPDTSYWIGRADDSWSGQNQIAEVQIWSVALSAEQIFKNLSPKPFDRVWRYLPFQGNTLEKLTAILTNDAAISAYNNDPFDHHAIAQLRIGAYEKAIVMKYIDNLLDWGDSLFTQDTWESITQATMLYLLAYDLLGQKPENLGNCKLPKPETFQDIKTQYQDKIPPFLIELEQHVANSHSSTLARTPFNDINAYFCVSENEQFTAYWSRVEDRLYKIRHCQNIQGIATSGGDKRP